jgi:hypothetical protein
MNRYGFIFGIILTALAVLGVLAYTHLEIYPRKVSRDYSREARANEYLALEQWLAKTGHPSRGVSRGSPARILKQTGDTVFVQASAFEWENAGTELPPWIAAGGSLIISVEEYFMEEEALGAFLAGFGIRAGTAASVTSEDDEVDYIPEYPVPDFDRRIKFILEEPDLPAGSDIMRDAEGLISLVSVPLGEGKLTVIGTPRFMRNGYIHSERNARLAWELCGAGRMEENQGPFFIRGRRQMKSLFGKLAERGNLTPLVVSILILIFTGFWMIIPGFGILKGDADSPLKPIGERFRAEARFMKKYRALDRYLEAYLGEIKYRNRGAETETAVREIEDALKTKEQFTYRNLIRDLHTLMNTMERL